MLNIQQHHQYQQFFTSLFVHPGPQALWCVLRSALNVNIFVWRLGSGKWRSCVCLWRLAWVVESCFPLCACIIWDMRYGYTMSRPCPCLCSLRDKCGYGITLSSEYCIQFIVLSMLFLRGEDILAMFFPFWFAYSLLCVKHLCEFAGLCFIGRCILISVGPVLYDSSPSSLSRALDHRGE